MKSLILLFILGAAVALSADGVRLTSDESAIRAGNGRVSLELSRGTQWNVSAAEYAGRNLVREIRMFQFLLPTGRELTASEVQAKAVMSGGAAVVEVERRCREYRCIETFRLAPDSDCIDVKVALEILSPIRIGRLHMPVVTGALGSDTLLHDDDGSLASAGTAGLLNRVGAGHDFYYGLMDSRGRAGLLVIEPGNRKEHFGIFQNYCKTPGRIKFGFERKNGRFGEMWEAGPGDRAEFNYRICFFQGDPESFLNGMYPGASVRKPQEIGIDAALRIFFDPTLYRDDRKMALLGSVVNPLSILFYRRSADTEVPPGTVLELELPADFRIRQAVPFNYWIPAAPVTEFRTEEGNRDGLPVRRWFLPVPHPVSSPADKDLFESHKQHQLHLYLEAPAVASARPFQWQYRLLNNKTGNGSVHRAPGVVLPPPENTEVPKRIAVWFSNAPMRHLVWADREVLDSYCRLFRSMGISVLAAPEDAPYMRPVLPDLRGELRRRGFRFHAPYTLRKIATDNLTDPEPGSVRMRFDGKRNYTGNNPQHSFCPSYLLRSDTPLRRTLQTFFAELGNVDFMWNDWEGKTFEGCYCPECRKAFAAFSGISQADAVSLTPKQLVTRYPVEWIRFRNRQSAQMFALFKRLARETHPGIQAGMDFELIDFFTVYPGLGRGYAAACEDPRLMDGAEFDFVLPDSLRSGTFSFDQAALCTGEIRLPILPKTGSVGGMAFYSGAWVSRRLLAEFQRRPLGLENWPKLVRTTALAYAAAGAKGVLLEGAPFDAFTALEYAELSRSLARMEAYWDGGVEIAEQCTIEQTGKPGNDRDTLAGSWITTGCAPDRRQRVLVRKNGGTLVISVFNFDPENRAELRIRLPETIRGPRKIHDPLTRELVLSPSGGQIWNAEELADGIVIPAGAVDCAFLVVSKVNASVDCRSTRPTARPESSPRPFVFPKLKTGNPHDLPAAICPELE